MNLGYCFCLLPFVKRVALDEEGRKKIVLRNMRFFNSNPYLSSFLVGISLNFEEKNFNSKTGVDFKKLERLKRRLSESLAVIGDQLLWARILPLTAFIGFTVSFIWGILGPVLFFLIFNFVQIYVRFKGVVLGYREGENAVRKLDFKKFNKIAEYLFGCGAFLSGFVFVMIPVSQSYKNMPELIVFALSAVVMFFFLRLKITVPVSLVVLIFAGIFTGSIIY